MSRDFILVFSGGVVSLITTLVVLFVMDYFYRREQRADTHQGQPKAGDQAPLLKTVVQAVSNAIVPDTPKPGVIDQATAAKVVEPTLAKTAVEEKPVPVAV